MCFRRKLARLKIVKFESLILAKINLEKIRLYDEKLGATSYFSYWFNCLTAALGLTLIQVRPGAVGSQNFISNKNMIEIKYTAKEAKK